MWPFEVRLHIVACNRGSPSTDTSFTPKCLHLILKHVRMFVTWLHGQVSQCFGGLIKHVQVAVSRNLSKFHRPNEGSTINRDSLYSPCLRDFRIYTMVQTSNKSDLQHQYQCFSTCIKGTSTVTHTHSTVRSQPLLEAAITMKQPKFNKTQTWTETAVPCLLDLFPKELLPTQNRLFCCSLHVPFACILSIVAMLRDCAKCLPTQWTVFWCFWSLCNLKW